MLRIVSGRLAAAPFTSIMQKEVSDLLLAFCRGKGGTQFLKVIMTSDIYLVD